MFSVTDASVDVCACLAEGAKPRTLYIYMLKDLFVLYLFIAELNMNLHTNLVY